MNSSSGKIGRSSRGRFDLIVVGAGPAGLSCAVSAAAGGLRVAVVELESRIGGSLHVTGGMMSAAGTRRQQAKGIADDVKQHLADVRRMAIRGYQPALQELAVRSAPRLVDWLDEEGFRFVEECPAIYLGHEPYSVPRTYWGQAGGESILETLTGLWGPLVAAGKISLFLNHLVGELETDAAGRVVGVVVGDMNATEVIRIRARSVVLASGGFGSNASLFERLSGLSAKPPVASMPGSQGGGLEAALEIGAKLRSAKEILRLGRLPRVNNTGRVDHSLRADLEALARPPREIWVNADGERFVDESEPVNTVQEHALLGQPGASLWAIWDAQSLTAGQSLVRGWTPATYHAEASLGLRELWKADSLADLAAAAGISAAGLAGTVTRWNDGVGPWPSWQGAPKFRISRPPYFAMRFRGSVLATFSGVTVTSRLGVVNVTGDAIRGLYAVGEVVGSATYSGEAFCGGMLITPALALGRALGRALAAGVDGIPEDSDV